MKKKLALLIEEYNKKTIAMHTCNQIFFKKIIH